MHLYEAGVPLPYIRDILGHVDLSTTEIYARASTEAKRKALEAAYQDIVTSDLPEWNQDAGLLDWLDQPLTVRTRDYAQCSPANVALTRPRRPALRITQHCA